MREEEQEEKLVLAILFKVTEARLRKSGEFQTFWAIDLVVFSML